MDFPALFMTFLSDNWVFFQEGEITWNGKRHAINGLQVNASKVDDFKPFISENVDFDNIKEALDYFIAFLTNIEKDEEFVVPRSAIASGIAKGLPEGDLTPITFANLAACGSALMVREVGENDYAVLFDRRLAQGIPCFFNLSARLIWDFRQLTRSGRGVPFKVGFLRGRSIDADACFDESVDVVPGAQDDILVMDVDSAPAISLDAKQEGLRLDTLKACLNTLDPERFAEIEGSPSDIAIGNPTESMMEDSELFQALLLQEARAMPRCYAIEGTGYKGRAERVEAMKPGDPVILESDWQCDYFDPVGIEVFNTENQTLGYLSLGLSEETPVVGGFRQLACMLPYVVATVDSVTPVSARSRGAKYPLMDIRVELIGEALDRSVEPVQLTAEALDACKTMFSLPPEASGASSILLPDEGEFEEPVDDGRENVILPAQEGTAFPRNHVNNIGLAGLTDLYALTHAQDAKEVCASLARGISEVPRSLACVVDAVRCQKQGQRRIDTSTSSVDKECTLGEVSFIKSDVDLFEEKSQVMPEMSQFEATMLRRLDDSCGRPELLRKWGLSVRVPTKTHIQNYSNLKRYLSSNNISVPILDDHRILLVLDTGSSSEFRVVIKAYDFEGNDLGPLIRLNDGSYTEDQVNERTKILSCLLPFVKAIVMSDPSDMRYRYGADSVDLHCKVVIWFPEDVVECRGSQKRLLKEVLETSVKINEGQRDLAHSAAFSMLIGSVAWSNIDISINGDQKPAWDVLAEWKNESCPINGEAYSEVVRRIVTHLLNKEAAFGKKARRVADSFSRFSWVEGELTRTIVETAKRFDLMYFDLIEVCQLIIDKQAPTRIVGSDFRSMIVATLELLRDVELRSRALRSRYPTLYESLPTEKTDKARISLGNLLYSANKKLQKEAERKRDEIQAEISRLGKKADGLQDEINKRRIFPLKKIRMQEKELLLARIDELNAQLKEIDQEYKSLMLSKDDFEGEE